MLNFQYSIKALRISASLILCGEKNLTSITTPVTKLAQYEPFCQNLVFVPHTQN